MMYFITPSKPGIFLIGIYENQLYAFGEKKSKLCIYQKSVFDSGDWKEFFIININVLKAECCENGLHVAAGIDDDAIWIAARDKECRRVFSIDIDSKGFLKWKMLEKLHNEFEVPNLSLSCNCLNPIIRYECNKLNVPSSYITPRRYQKEIGIYVIQLSLNISGHCLLLDSINSFPLDNSPASSYITVNHKGEALFISKKKTF